MEAVANNEKVSTKPESVPKPKSKTRTRKVGGLRAFTTGASGLMPVANWPDAGPTTRQGAKDWYLKLKLEGKIVLMRDAGVLEGEQQISIKFKE